MNAKMLRFIRFVYISKIMTVINFSRAAKKQNWRENISKTENMDFVMRMRC